MNQKDKSTLIDTALNLNKIRLGGNLSNKVDYYFLGAQSETRLHTLDALVNLETRSKKLKPKIIYSGPTDKIKPDELSDLLEITVFKGDRPNKKYKDYTGQQGEIGVSIDDSYQSILKAYERKYRYYPHYCIIAMVNT